MQKNIRDESYSLYYSESRREPPPFFINPPRRSTVKEIYQDLSNSLNVGSCEGVSSSVNLLSRIRSKCFASIYPENSIFLRNGGCTGTRALYIYILSPPTHSISSFPSPYLDPPPLPLSVHPYDIYFTPSASSEPLFHLNQSPCVFPNFSSRD